MTPKIFIVNDSGHRFDLALRNIPNGKLVAMTKGDVNPTHVDRLSFILNQFIAHSDPDDYLLLSGTPILNAIAGMLWILRHPRANLLIFDAKTQSYEEKIVSRLNYQKMIDRELFE